MTTIGRMQWSKNGVTVYDGTGSFVARMSDPRDCALISALVSDALRVVVQEQQRRMRFKGDPEVQAEEVDGAPV